MASISVTNIQVGKNDTVHFYDGSTIIQSVSQIVPNTSPYILRDGLNIVIINRNPGNDFQLKDGSRANDHLIFNTMYVLNVGARSYTPVNQALQTSGTLNETRAKEIYSDLVNNIFKGCCECSENGGCDIQYQYSSDLETGQFYTISGKLLMSMDTLNGSDFSDLLSEFPNGSWLWFTKESDPNSFFIYEISNYFTVSGLAVWDYTLVDSRGVQISGDIFCLDIKPALGSGGGGTTYVDGTETIDVSGTGTLVDPYEVSVISQLSITDDASGIKFVNDQLDPAFGLTKTTRFYYGTDFAGIKGYHWNFLQFDGGTVWSPYLSDYEGTGKLNFGASSGWILGSAAFNDVGTGKALVNSNIFGNNNLFYATNVQYSNILGYDNFNAVGSNPLWHNTVLGYGNVGAGSSSGSLMQYNTLIGTVNLTGTSLGNVSYAVALGSGNLTNMRGDNNIAIGYLALLGVSGSTGIRNLGIGRGNTGSLTTGSYNLIVGDNSAILLSSGSEIIVFGKDAANSLTTGSGGIFIGTGANGNATADDQIAIGRGVVATGTGVFVGFIQAGTSANVLYYDPTTKQITYGAGGGGGSGTVTSVGLTGDGTIFDSSVTGSPVTTSGTLAPSLKTQTANRVLAGPTTGAAAAPTFRSLVSDDLPTVPITKGGTGATDAATARTNLGIINTVTLSGGNVGGTIAAGVTSYLAPTVDAVPGGTESSRASVIMFAGNLKNLGYTTLTAQPGTGSFVVTVRKATGMGAFSSTTITTTIAAGSAAGIFTDVVNTSAVAVGDRVSLQIVNNASGASAQIGTWQILIEATQ